MNCNSVKERINDFVDGVLPECDREPVAAHLASCAGCRREEAALRALLECAGKLDRESALPEDLWEGIAGRIAQTGPVAERRHGPRRPWTLAAAAAVVLLLAVVAVTATRLRPGSPTGGTVSKAGANDALEACARTRQDLLENMRYGIGSLDSGITAGVRGDLLVIESAIAEIQSALDADPGNDRLQQMLVMVCDKQDVLIAEMVRLAESA